MFQSILLGNAPFLDEITITSMLEIKIDLSLEIFRAAVLSITYHSEKYFICHITIFGGKILYDLQISLTLQSAVNVYT